TSTAAPPPAAPTVTIWPTSNATPITTDPYPIFQVTPIPGPTYTPTPQPVEAADIEAPAVRVIATYELPMEQLELLSTATEESAEFQLLGWTPDNKVLVQKVFYQDENGVSKQSGVEGPWQVSPFTGEASLLENWDNPMRLSQAQQEFVDSLIANNMLPAGVQRAYQEDIVPNNQYIAITPTLGKIFIYELGNNQPVMILPDSTEANYIRYGALPVWSPDGKSIMYSVALDDPTVDPPLDVKIMVTDIETRQTAQIDLPGANIIALAWSPDSRYIAYVASLWKQAPFHLYIMNRDGTGTIDATPNPELWLSDKVFWSPQNDLVAYTDSLNSIFVLQLSRN
ncbi:MAG: hypothetical protein D6732_04445, partial [Methanobacteriota archaeon]